MFSCAGRERWPDNLVRQCVPGWPDASWQLWPASQDTNLLTTSSWLDFLLQMRSIWQEYTFQGGSGGETKAKGKRLVGSGLSSGRSEISPLHVCLSASDLPPRPLRPPEPLPPAARPHYHNCVQNMRGRGSDHVILFTPCLALFTNDMPLTAKRTGARRHLLIRAVGPYQRRMAGNGYPVTNQISGRTKSGPHLPGLH